MPQHDFDLANQSRTAFRADLNNALQALATLSEGAGAPATTYKFMLWADTGTNSLKRRNAANSAWIKVASLSDSFVLSRSSNTILGEADFGKTIRATASFTQTFAAAATLGDGWRCDYRIESGATITYNPNGSENIDGATTKVVTGPASGTIHCDGTAFFTVGFPASESGTWTPAISFATPGDLSVAYTNQVGTWVKTGRLVLATFAITTSSFTHTTASGNLAITGLPFAAHSLAEAFYGAALVWTGITTTRSDLCARLDPGATAAGVIASGSALSLQAITAAQMPSGGSVILRAALPYIAAN